jgi:hypothetical protein
MKRKFQHYAINTVLIGLASLFAFGFLNLTYHFKFNCDWFHCEINNEHYSSPHRENVELWRDDKLINADYYKELSELRAEGLASMYRNNHNNWTGD